MFTQARCESLIALAVKHAGRRVDGIEVTISGADVATSRFANNGMTQNQSPDRVEISVRVQKGGKQARLACDQLGAADIKQLVDNAILAASFLEKDAGMLPMVNKTQAGKLLSARGFNRYDTGTARLSPDARAQEVADIIEVASGKQLVSAGVFASGSHFYAIGNNKGLFRFHRESSAECSITMRHFNAAGEESTGWTKAHSTRAGDIDAAAMARRAAHKAVASANPRELTPGRYTVILEAPAVLDLLCFLWGDFAGTSHVDKLSCFLNRVGQKVLGDNITIVDDPYHALQAGAPFDGEGIARQPVTLVENGVIKNLVFGRRSATKLGATPTGHGLQEPSAEGEYPLNLVVSGGSHSLEQMIASTKRGILLTRVWYVREVDPTTKIVTGMTRDGTFLVENGEIKTGIKNMRFNQSLIEMLNNVVFLGPSVRTAAEEGFPAVLPAMTVEDFNFSSVTRF